LVTDHCLTACTTKPLQPTTPKQDTSHLCAVTIPTSPWRTADQHTDGSRRDGSCLPRIRRAASRCFEMGSIWQAQARWQPSPSSRPRAMSSRLSTKFLVFFCFRPLRFSSTTTSPFISYTPCFPPVLFSHPSTSLTWPWSRLSYPASYIVLPSKKTCLIRIRQYQPYPTPSRPSDNRT
jgi:hypothetical protein